MLLENILLIVFSLAMGDVLAFSVRRLCLIFTDKSKIFLSKKTLIEYIDYIFSQFKNNRINFLIYSFLLYSLSIIATWFCYKNYGFSIKSISALLFCYGMIVLSFVDAKTQYLPDVITKPLIIIGIMCGYFEYFTDFNSSIIGALAGYLSLWGINTLFLMLRGVDGMGYGDFKLLAAIGAFAGWQILPLAVMASSILGIFVAIGLTYFGKNKLSAPSPFGPSLAIAGIVSLFWGNEIIVWYLGLYS